MAHECGAALGFICAQDKRKPFRHSLSKELIIKFDGRAIYGLEGHDIKLGNIRGIADQG
eukprot:UC4_evm1s201